MFSLQWHLPLLQHQSNLHRQNLLFPEARTAAYPPAKIFWHSVKYPVRKRSVSGQLSWPATAARKRYRQIRGRAETFFSECGEDKRRKALRPNLPCPDRKNDTGRRKRPSTDEEYSAHGCGPTP